MKRTDRLLARLSEAGVRGQLPGLARFANLYSDANWDSNASDRRSTRAGVLMHGSHYIKSWSKTQPLVALSSAESELHALVRASAEAVGRTLGQTWRYKAKAWETQTLGLQFLVRPELAHAKGGAVSAPRAGRPTLCPKFLECWIHCANFKDASRTTVQTCLGHSTDSTDLNPQCPRLPLFMFT